MLGYKPQEFINATKMIEVFSKIRRMRMRIFSIHLEKKLSPIFCVSTMYQFLQFYGNKNAQNAMRSQIEVSRCYNQPNYKDTDEFV